ncbi:S-layer homology domain-containing protein [Paenibacillus sp. yr247]|uniref:S-layer homology domain-containing protein n=1 Tax=Paenibacillus sp. yr247 TaxID=1761880 RepID=UPI000884B04F|nr:S-layer homology domain-containing protein [Paenibacillus sp. yr247]SDO79233.1 S-layer homology domain-containing protein [Paenibacillus sp. yr247]
MKKSLFVVLSATIALSMFSSVAFGKTSADFTDLKDLDTATKAKFDTMISAGIFNGVSDTAFGLHDEMNRAQFAKVAALIMGLDINKDLNTSSFTDVSIDDRANGYALPYIEALKAAGVTDGYGEGTYNPAGKVTKEQLAAFLVRVLGKDADAQGKTFMDKTVSDWAQGYVALALELKLFPTAEGSFGGVSNATRDLLLLGAYEAKQQLMPVGEQMIHIMDFAFSKKALTVKAGTKVTFMNEEDVPHTIVSDGLFDSSKENRAGIKKGESYSYTFDKPGVYKVYCTFHPFMNTTITVK